MRAVGYTVREQPIANPTLLEMSMPDVDAERIVSQNKPDDAKGGRGFVERFELLGPVALVVAFLLPFLRRAFSIDDPLFIWIGQQILKDPLDPYGFSVNWSVMQEPMSQVMQNPPLNSYFIAGVIRYIGLSEMRLHAAFLLPAMAVAWGTYLVARRFCTRPLEATLAAILTPAFLVCGSTVMCDMMMVAFWVWAVHFWVKGADENHLWMIVLAVVLISMSALTKYFGAVLIPLLLAYHLLAKRKPAYLLGLLIPVLILIAYNYWTKSLYGRGLALDAFGLSGQYRAELGATLLPKTVIALAFAGGCLATVMFLAPLLWTRRALACWIVLAAALALFFGFSEPIGSNPLDLVGREHWLLVVHLGLFAAAGVSLMAMAVGDLASRRDADSALLFLWLVGALVFAGLLNWTVNGRVLLPMAPVVGIVMMRRIEQRRSGGAVGAVPSFALPWVLSALLAVTVAHADCQFANSQRIAAYSIHEQFSAGGNVWFQGHWGFQYYMENLGARPVEYGGTKFGPSDVVITPENNTRVSLPPQDLPGSTAIAPSSRWLSTMCKTRRTAFHSDAWGPIPYGFGLAAPEVYYITPMNAE
jgi:hypothetical protein